LAFKWLKVPKNDFLAKKSIKIQDFFWMKKQNMDGNSSENIFLHPRYG
jgi:hypothetical protein